MRTLTRTTSPRIASLTRVAALTGALTLCLTGCFGPRQVSASAADDTASSSTTTSASASRTTMPPTTSTSTTSTSTSGTATSTSHTSTTSSSSTAGELPRCRAANTTVSAGVEEGSAGAGSYSVTVSVRNNGDPCWLVGFPGVSMVTGDSGQQLGKPADRTGKRGTGFDLGSGQTATTSVRVAQAGNYDPCGETPARGLRIYLPGETHSQFAPLDTLVGCSDPSTPTLMHVKAFGQA